MSDNSTQRTPADTDRYARGAATRFARAASLVYHQHRDATNAEIAWLAGYQARNLLVSAVDEAELLVGVVDNDGLDDAIEATQRLLTGLKNRRLAAKLADTHGRTGVEAELFAERARTMTEG